MKIFLKVLLFTVVSQVGTVSYAQAPSPSAPIQVACINDSGAVMNADPSQVCAAILPKCSTLKQTIITKVKDLMSQKIWGYYNGKDIDLSKSTPSNLVGNAIAYPVCSVVGQTLKYNNNGDLELTQQSLGLKQSCGLRPGVNANAGLIRFELTFTGVNGVLWSAYLLGAYPWVIRKNAADVLNAIKDDLSNLSSLLVHAQAMGSDINALNAQMQSVNQGLTTAAKASCNVTGSTLINDCLSGAVSINNPSQRLCTIVKAALATNEGALPNIVAYEVMQRTQAQYDSTFGKVISFQDPVMQDLSNQCSKTDVSFPRLRGGREKLAMTAACFFGGAFCATSDKGVTEATSDLNGDGNGEGKCAGKDAQRAVTFSSGAKMVNTGFASVVEKLIRETVCGQTSTSSDNVCDQINIPSKPVSAP